jgi:hypothetical protein
MRTAKNISLLLILALAAISPAFAQRPVAEDPTWVPVQTDEEFSVMWPSERIDFENVRVDERHSYRKYSLTGNGNFFYVLALGKDDTTLDTINKFIDENKGVGRPVTIGMFKGMRYDFDDDEGYRQVIVTVRGKTGRYVFHGVSEDKCGDQPDNFIGFITLRGDGSKFAETGSVGRSDPDCANTAVPSPKSGAAASQNAAAVSVPKPVPGISDGTGNGGVGSGIASTGAANSDKPPVSRSLKITSKQRASYTDLARIYRVDGVVRLRITFSANGTIGAVSAVSCLPFGLTKSAIEAARKIAFEPMIINSLPVSAAKIVEYQFSLY